MNKLKLIALDIDGTLLNDEGKITLKVINSIKKVIKKGIYVILCTGRMHQSANKFAYIFNENLPIISYNGALIKNKNKIIYKKEFPSRNKNEIFLKTIQYGLQPNIYTENNLYSIKGNPFIEKYSKKIDVKYKLLSKKLMLLFLNKIKIIKITGIGFPFKINEFIKKEQNIYCENLCLSKSFNYFLEISKKNVNKGKALKFIGKFLKIKTNEMMGIGDNLNDEEMLKIVGFPVVMGNGINKLKNKGYFISKTNNKDGVAYAISQFIV